MSGAILVMILVEKLEEWVGGQVNFQLLRMLVTHTFWASKQETKVRKFGGDTENGVGGAGNGANDDSSCLLRNKAGDKCIEVAVGDAIDVGDAGEEFSMDL